MLAAFLTTILFSISVVCANRSTRIIGGTEANFWRLTCAAFFLALWAHLFGKGFSGDSFPLFFLSGIIGVGADVFLFQSLPRLGSRLTLLLIQCFSALSAALIEWLWLDTTLTQLQMCYGLTILVGVAIALAPGKHLNLTRPILLFGIFFSFLAGFGNGFGAVLSRKAFAVAHDAGQNIDGGTAGYQRVVGGLIVAGISLLIVKRREIANRLTNSEPPQVLPSEKWPRVWGWVLANGFAGQTLGVACFQIALKTTPTALVLAIVALTPLVVIPFAYVVEGEKIQARSIAGGALAVIGAIGLVVQRHLH